MLTMPAELISIAFLFLIFVVMLCVIKMYLAVIALCEQRAYPVQGAEMRGRQRADRATEDRTRAALGNRPALNQVNQRTGGGAEREKKGKITQRCAIFRNRKNAKGREPKNTGREPGLYGTGSGRFKAPCTPLLSKKVIKVSFL